MNKLKNLLKPADILLIVPPFSLPDSQSLAVHTLQAFASQKGFSVQIFYANIHFAKVLGKDYEALCNSSTALVGERVFSKAAFGDEGKNSLHENIYDINSIYGPEKGSKFPIDNVFYPPPLQLDLSRLREIEEIACRWVRDVSDAIKGMSYKLIGCTTSYEQTNASFAILKHVKKAIPHVTTLIGGFNCEGNMAEGIASLDPERKVIDYIFSGESENKFTAFLENLKSNKKNKDRIISSSPLRDMDSIPPLDYSDYFTQLYSFFPEYREKKDKISLSYETSRGCWWGEKNQCLFCGYDERMSFRQKSADKVYGEIDDLKKYPFSRLDMADLIMPQDYFKDLIPKLERDNNEFDIYYEQRASLDYKKLKALKKSRINYVQPGLETFSNSLLKIMIKGNSVATNIRFLRMTGSLEINAYWNMIWGFPGEKRKDYLSMIEFLPWLFHLKPPIGLFHLILVKFSPIYRDLKKYGIRDVHHLPVYGEIYPSHTDFEKIAYIFTGEYEAETYSDPKLIIELEKLLKQWNDRWPMLLTRPRLHLYKNEDNSYTLLDTRMLPETENTYELDKDTVIEILIGGNYRGSETQKWALKKKIALQIDGAFIPLMTSSPELWDEMLPHPEEKPPEKPPGPLKGV
ncbi:MAG: RiPP maturation radical SAM C-methyltransferase [Spirochaetaceae bacterium]|nr:RiPP maturation radical SAM C-methyltransferase [Spirochaetaceae bacterium]